MKKSILTILATGLAAGAMAQTSIPLTNGDFEEPDTGKISTDWGQIPGWSSDSAPSDSGVETGWTSSGTYSGYLYNGDPAVWQTSSYMIQSGDAFNLQFLSRNNWSQGESGDQVLGNLQAVLYYDDGGTRTPFASSVAETDNATGAAEEFQLLGAAAPSAAVGHALGVEFQNVTDTGTANNSWLLVDNVRLSTVPEPGTIALWTLGALGTLALVRRRRS